MKKLTTGILASAAFALGTMVSGGPAHAASCNVDKPGADLSFAEAKGVYDCLKEKMVEGYKKGDKRWIPIEYVGNYRSWKPAATGPAAPGTHGDRFLMTYVNAIGHDQYTKYAEDITMPTGTVIAKESFTVSKKGKAKAGPLFIMEKVAPGTSPETEDWYYMMVSAKGKPQGINVVSACHECHSGFDFQGFMGYPVEEVRLGQ
ncbi:MAG: cytochrome P460 family protein [Pseudomonadota bacterium]